MTRIWLRMTLSTIAILALVVNSVASPRPTSSARVMTRTGISVTGLFEGLIATSWGKRIASGDVDFKLPATRPCRHAAVLNAALTLLQDPCDRDVCNNATGCYGHQYSDNFLYNTCAGDYGCYTDGVYFDFNAPENVGYQYVDWCCLGFYGEYCCTQSNTCSNPN